MARDFAPWASLLMRAKDFLPLFANIEIDEDGTIKPAKPLNADQLRRRSERQASTQRKMRDEDARHASKSRDLKDRLA
jgi:hypothetical protein